MHLGEPSIDVDVLQIPIEKTQDHSCAVVHCLKLSQPFWLIENSFLKRGRL